MVPASAAAATFGEAEPSMVTAVRPDCTGPAGAPGELFAMDPDGVRFLSASRGGVVAGAGVELDLGVSTCAAVATSASGAGVVACCAESSVPVGITRDPGGAWSQPAELGPGEWHVGTITAAVSARGDTIVAWSESQGKTARVSAVRRTAGGAFGAPEVLGGPYRGAAGRVSAGIAADGDAVVLWTAPKSTPANTVDVTVATAPAAGPFSPAAALGVLNAEGRRRWR